MNSFIFGELDLLYVGLYRSRSQIDLMNIDEILNSQDKPEEEFG